MDIASRFKNEVLFKANPRPVAMYCAPPYCMSSWKACLLVCCREMKKAREPASSWCRMSMIALMGPCSRTNSAKYGMTLRIPSWIRFSALKVS